MDPVAIFVTQFVISLLVFTLIAVWYATPWLAEKPLPVALAFLIVPHAFRRIGLSFLVPMRLVTHETISARRVRGNPAS
jgi:hypothetical protein